MTLTKAKLTAFLIMASLIGAAITGAAVYALDKEEKPACAPCPKPTPSPSPTPSPTVTPTTEASPVAESDAEQITRVGKAYFAAFSGRRAPGLFQVRDIGTTFATAEVADSATAGGGGLMVFKKALDTWVPLWQGNGSIPEDIRQDYGIPADIFD